MIFVHNKVWIKYNENDFLKRELLMHTMRSLIFFWLFYHASEHYIVQIYFGRWGLLHNNLGTIIIWVTMANS